MSTIGERMQELRRIMRLHRNWFTVVMLGKDAVSKEELQELESYGKLPLDQTLDWTTRSYVLGRLRAVLKTAEYKKLNYEQVDEELAKAKFSTLEEYALEYAKLHAAEGLKNLSDDITAGAFDRLKQAMQEAVNEASVRGIVRDKVALAVEEKTPYQRLASTLAKDLRTDWRRDWRMVAETELHRAKQVGAAQAIINKIGPYRHSDGQDSLVSIVPNPATCIDCSSHYLDEAGNPKVYRLSALLQQGSNADAGVKHTRAGGKHNHWKTTLPPLHPRCGCRIVYIPKGMGWENGKLQVTDEDVYVEELRKAVDTKTMAAKITPPGPQRATGKDKSPAQEASLSPPSMPGMPAPGNTPGPGRPPSAGKIEEPKGPEEQMVDCPFGGGDDCKAHGGNGAKSHKADGTIMEAHRRAQEAGASPTDPEAAAADLAQERLKAEAWGKQDHPHDVVMDHLSSGKLAEVRDTKDNIEPEDMAEARKKGITGVTDSYVVRIEGNGRGMMKPSPSADTCNLDLGNCPRGVHQKHEAATYDYFKQMGLGSMVPPTTIRHHDGKEMSVQSFKEGYTTLSSHLEDSGAAESDAYKSKTFAHFLLDNAEDPEKMEEHLMTMAVAELASAAGDSHTGNMMAKIDEETGKISDLVKIDNSAHFNNSMHGIKSSTFKAMAKRGKVTIPESLKKRWEGTSFHELKMGQKHIPDWQIGQTFMRQQYLMHLQEAEGHIDPEKFRMTWSGADTVSLRVARDMAAKEGIKLPDKMNGPDVFDMAMPRGGVWDDLGMKGFLEREEKGELPHQLFESWAKAWLDDVSSDPSHPHHESAKALQDVGIFMPHGRMDSPEAARKAGLHKAYEKSIKPRRDLPKELSGKKRSASEQKRGIPTTRHSPEADDTQRFDVEGPTASDPKQGTAAATPASSGLREKGTAAGSRKRVRKHIPLFLDLTKAWK